MSNATRRASIWALTAMVAAIVAAGCAGTTPDDGEESSTSKDQIREKQLEEGKGDRAVDYCARHDYYGDDDCDRWCPEADPDCGNIGSSCQSGSDCAAGEYCAKDGQDACTPSATGECRATPDVCTEQYAPVCGCDDTTYGNECKANAAGVNVAATGECPSSNSCQSNADCFSDEYCAKDGQDACTPSATGECRATADVCDEQYAPVCGCDGTTYGNECKAEAAGVNVAATGECPSSNSCQSNADCGSGEYCAKDGQDACTPSSTGECTETSDACIEVYDPVCGCDGTTYGNECKAKAAGVNVASDGRCS